MLTQVRGILTQDVQLPFVIVIAVPANNKSKSAVVRIGGTAVDPVRILLIFLHMVSEDILAVNRMSPTVFVLPTPVTIEALLILKSVATAELLLELDSRRRCVLDEFGCESLKPGFFAGVTLEKLTCLLVRLGGAQKGQALACRLTMAAKGNITVEQNMLLNEVARGNSTMEEFLEIWLNIL